MPKLADFETFIGMVHAACFQPPATLPDTYSIAATEDLEEECLLVLPLGDPELPDAADLANAKLRQLFEGDHRFAAYATRLQWTSGHTRAKSTVWFIIGLERRHDAQYYFGPADNASELWHCPDPSVPFLAFQFAAILRKCLAHQHPGITTGVDPKILRPPDIKAFVADILRQARNN